MNLGKNILKYINLIFLFSFFPSLVTGVFLPNAIYALLVITNITLNFSYLKKNLQKFKIFTLIFFLFYSLIIFSSLNSSFVIFSLKTSLLYFSYIIYVISIIFIFLENDKYEKFFLYIGLITFFILSLDAIYEIFNGSNILEYSAIKGRIAGLFGDRWVIGSYLVRLLPIMIGMFLINYYKIDKKIRYFAYIVFFLSSIIIIFSGERKALLLFCLYFFLIVFYLSNKINLKKITIFFTASIILIISPFFIDDYKSRIKQQVVHHATNTNLDENQYLSMFISSYKMFLDSPIIGIGPNNFRKVCQFDEYNLSRYSCNTHTHNIPLQLLSEIGFIGFMLVYVVFFYFLYTLFLLFRKEFDLKHFGLYSIICSIIINLWPLVPSGNFFLSWYGIIFYLPIGLYLMYLSKYKILR